ncbi:tyrosine-type recombinase/integrase [Pseudomonas asplenii]|uniref:tyrosine-type recombinase/integrase n=1 Tax=Pseudomonas asplenii TaxID=53407 RepID=UPI000367F993|nr:integrase arm-type DNA-binding domain-containing protein [Pseudomonas fuscovaginae]
MALTDKAVRHAKPSAMNYTLSDGAGLTLFVCSTGAKQWHWRFYWQGKQSRISLGSYPALGLKEARQQRDQARTWLAQGLDPRAQRRDALRALEAQAHHTFAAVFAEWRDFKAQSLSRGRQSTLSQIERIFDKDVLPALGALPMAEVSRQDLLGVLRRLEQRRAFTVAEKCRTWFNQLFRYAMVEKGLEQNPAADLDIVAIPKPPVSHNPFLLMDGLSVLVRWSPSVRRLRPRRSKVLARRAERQITR